MPFVACNRHVNGRRRWFGQCSRDIPGEAVKRHLLWKFHRIMTCAREFYPIERPPPAAWCSRSSRQASKQLCADNLSSFGAGEWGGTRGVGEEGRGDGGNARGGGGGGHIGQGCSLMCMTSSSDDFLLKRREKGGGAGVSVLLQGDEGTKGGRRFNH